MKSGICLQKLESKLRSTRHFGVISRIWDHIFALLKCVLRPVWNQDTPNRRIKFTIVIFFTIYDIILERSKAF